jgi:hypothetical protein
METEELRRTTAPADTPTGALEHAPDVRDVDV